MSDHYTSQAAFHYIDSFALIVFFAWKINIMMMMMMMISVYNRFAINYLPPATCWGVCVGAWRRTNRLHIHWLSKTDWCPMSINRTSRRTAAAAAALMRPCDIVTASRACKLTWSVASVCLSFFFTVSAGAASTSSRDAVSVGPRAGYLLGLHLSTCYIHSPVLISSQD